jgi:signal transduction histidine kinase
MRELWRSAAYRLAFGYTALCALAVLALGLAIYFSAGAMLQRDLDRYVAEEMMSLQREYGEGGIPDVIDAIAKHRRRPANAFHYALFASDGRVLLNDARLATAPAGWGHDELHLADRPAANARVFAVRLGGGETLVVASDTRHLDSLEATLLVLLGIGFVAIIALGTAGALSFGLLLRRRLERISTIAQSIVAGDLSRRMAVGRSGDEFDRASESLNLMLDRIAQLVENLRQVSNDVAHDLRTPLQRLRGAVEGGLRGPRQVEPLRLALEHAQEQTDAILALFEGILHICEVEAGEARTRFAMVDLAALASKVCEMYGPAVDDGQRTLDCTSEEAMPVLGDRDLLTQMLTNLLDNAILHTPPGTAIAVSIRSAGAGVLLSVADTGPGVAKADRDRIVRRFVRLDRGRTTPGHGLGLNLVAAIAAAHGGRLAIHDNRPGLRAEVRLPAAPVDRPERSFAAAERSIPTTV